MAGFGPKTREMTPDDLPALCDLWASSWKRTLPAIDFEAQHDWLVGHLAGLAAEGAHIRVWPRQGPALGFVTVHPVTGYIDQLAVAAAAWGTGVGAGLLEEARRLSPYRLELLVNKDNPRAVRFYEKHGFVRLGEGFSLKSGLPLWKMAWEPQ